MSEPYVYTLKHPIVLKNKDTDEVIETIKAVAIQRPKGKHLRRIGKIREESEQTFSLISDLAQLPPSTVDELDGEDFIGIGEIIEGFFGKSPRPATGRTSSGT